MTMLLVAAGSAVGACARYLLDRLVSSRLSPAFPWGTCLVNVTGSFALGVLASFARRYGLPDDVLAAVGTGVLGSYTTFSAFSFETVRLAETGARWAALANVGASLLLGLAAAAGGLGLTVLW